MKDSNKGTSIFEIMGAMLISIFIIMAALAFVANAKPQELEINKKLHIETKSAVIDKTLSVIKMVQPVDQVKPTVIEQVTENHYHFEALITVLKYIGFGLLGVLTVFSSIKSLSLLKKYWIVRSATKESKKILNKFDNEFEENKNYLSFIRKISDQVIVNSILIDNRKNKETVVNLIVTNENLKDRLNFLESNFVKTMK